jgi:SAM-dependent methyltransferase
MITTNWPSSGVRSSILLLHQKQASANFSPCREVEVAMSPSIGWLHDTVVHSRRVRSLCQEIAPVLPDGGRVLDVGCGDGLLSRALQQTRPDLTLEGVDVMVRENSHIPVTSFDGSVLPFAADSFDAVLFVDVLHHTLDPSVLLREAARVAGKAVVIKDHLKEGFMAGPMLRVMDWAGNAHHGVSLPFNYWTMAQWQEAFQEIGLDVDHWNDRPRLYPWPASLVFGRSLHFIARLTPASVRQ